MIERTSAVVSTPPRRVNPKSSLRGASRCLPKHPTTVREAITEAAGVPSWYSASFASTAGHTGSEERRSARWALRGLLRRKDVSVLPRIAKCGLPLGNSYVSVHRSAEGVGHMSGTQTCGSIWSCPVCAAKIRNHRQDEISRGFGRHIDAGGGAVLVTLTIRHAAGDVLDRMVELVSEGFRSVVSGRAWGEDRTAYGVLGQIRAFEITHGKNGWHPHLHVLIATRAPLDKADAAQLQQRIQRRWDRWLERKGWAPTVDGIGVRVDRVHTNADAVGIYIAKLQEGEAVKVVRKTNVSAEISRADMKEGRGGSRTPFQILADFGSDGLAADGALWHEFQLATRGRSALRWSRGLRELLLGDEPELTDEEIAAAAAEGGAIAMIPAPAYRALARRPYGEAYLLVAAEQGGHSGIIRYLRSLGIDPSGVLVPNETIDADGMVTA